MIIERTLDRIGLVGSSVPMQRVRRLLREIAPHDIPVLLIGPTGAGKELAAQALHQLSGRPGLFVPLNMASVPADLAESQLFGHQRGAFTGAIQDSHGAFRHAHAGTLFLDEINSTLASTQATLLRALDGSGVRPVGSTQEYTVDARVVAAANSDLEQACDRGEFRSDLLHRLRGSLIKLPSLAERRSDIPELATHLLSSMSPRVSLTPCALDTLGEALWPGNVRQLRHELRIAALRADDGRIDGRLVREVRQDMTIGVGGAADRRHLALVTALRAAQGRVEDAAQRLGRSRATVYRWCVNAGLDPRDFRAKACLPIPLQRARPTTRQDAAIVTRLPLAM